jgi:hypothetical protein
MQQARNQPKFGKIGSKYLLLDILNTAFFQEDCYSFLH